MSMLPFYMVKNRKFQLNLEIPQPHTYWANLVQINIPSIWLYKNSQLIGQNQ